MTCCDHGYGRPSWRPRVSDPATYRSGTPRNQSRGTAGRVAKWHAHLCGLATAIHEISGLVDLVGRCSILLSGWHKGEGLQQVAKSVLEHWRNRNSKSQISNNKQITMTKIQNSKLVLVIEYWNLRFVCNLVLGVWDLIIPSLQQTFP